MLVASRLILGYDATSSNSIARRLATILMTVSDHQGRLPVARLFTCDVSYSRAAVDKISTAKAHRAVPLR